MGTRIYITLDKAESYALGKLAEREYRDSRQQAALLIRHGLEQAGVLQQQTAVPSQTAVTQGVSHEAQ